MRSLSLSLSLSLSPSLSPNTLALTGPPFFDSLSLLLLPIGPLVFSSHKLVSLSLLSQTCVSVTPLLSTSLSLYLSIYHRSSPLFSSPPSLG